MKPGAAQVVLHIAALNAQLVSHQLIDEAIHFKLLVKAYGLEVDQPIQVQLVEGAHALGFECTRAPTTSPSITAV